MNKDLHWPGYAFENWKLYETAGATPDGIQKWKVVDEPMTWTTHELIGAMKSNLKSMPSDGIIEESECGICTSPVTDCHLAAYAA